MPQCDADPAGGEPRNEVWRHPFRRQGHQHDAAPRPGQQRHVGTVRQPDQRRIVYPRPLGRQERSLEMDAENAGHRVPAISCTAPKAAFILCGVSVISVGNSEVVPNRRWAAAIAAMPSELARR